MATVTLSKDEYVTTIQIRKENSSVVMDIRAFNIAWASIKLSKDEAKGIGSAMIGAAGGLEIASDN